MIDNSSYQYDPFSKHSISFDVSGIGNVLAPVSDAIFGTNFYGNNLNAGIAGQNLEWQKEYAKINEGLLRESWAREDNAVQRRVADLKAAGLSPTLAAGSAAATSSPIQLKAPQNEFRYENPFGGGILQAMASVLALKNADLQNQLLSKQVDTYGEPAWFKAINAILDKLGFDGTGFLSNLLHGTSDASSVGSSGSSGGSPTERSIIGSDNLTMSMNDYEESYLQGRFVTFMKHFHNYVNSDGSFDQFWREIF